MQGALRGRALNGAWAPARRCAPAAGFFQTVSTDTHEAAPDLHGAQVAGGDELWL